MSEYIDQAQRVVDMAVDLVSPGSPALSPRHFMPHMQPLIGPRNMVFSNVETPGPSRMGLRYRERYARENMRVPLIEVVRVIDQDKARRRSKPLVGTDFWPHLVAVELRASTVQGDIVRLAVPSTRALEKDIDVVDPGGYSWFNADLGSSYVLPNDIIDYVDSRINTYKEKASFRGVLI